MCPENGAIFGRTIDLLGPEGFEALQRAFVVVVGLGGVGSHAANALVRAGVGRLRLIDFDKMTPSSLNRHPVAVEADVGRSKADLLGQHLEGVASSARVEVAEAFFHAESADLLLDGSPDYVVDAIDSYSPKVALLKHCLEHGLQVVSCMGASARTDPTLIRVGDLWETRVCPLARVVRRGLSKHGCKREGITAVYSVEAPLPPLPPDHGDATLRRGRVRNRLPSLSTLPGIFGYAAATVVITRLANYQPGPAR
jgi:tRNA A37 threonylcarbamoyladenosine dehydratase